MNQEKEGLSNAELRAHSRGAQDERKRIALPMMNCDLRKHSTDCP